MRDSFIFFLSSFNRGFLNWRNFILDHWCHWVWTIYIVGWSSFFIWDGGTVDDWSGWFRVFSCIGNYGWICLYCSLIHWNIFFFFGFNFFGTIGLLGFNFFLGFLSSFLFWLFLDFLFNFFLNFLCSLSNSLFLFFRIFLKIFSKGFHKIISEFRWNFNGWDFRRLRSS